MKVDAKVKGGILLVGILAGLILFQEKEPTKAEPTGESHLESAFLRATRDFSSVVLEESEALPGRTVAEELDRLASTEGATTGFVRSINGVPETRSATLSGGEDWFFYVNGLLAPVGAGSVRLQPGDRVWWDFHRWSGSRSLGAVIGEFPRPFVAGDSEALPVRIRFAPGNEEAAARIQSRLVAEGVTEARIAPLGDQPEDASGPAHEIFVGTWSELAQSKLVRELHDRRERSGLYFQFPAEGGIRLFDYEGKEARTIAEGGIIAASRASRDAAASIWLIAGTTLPDLRRAVDRVVEKNGVEGFAALALTEQETIPLPHVH